MVNDKLKKYQKVIVIGLLIIIGIASTWLFYNQATNVFESDLAYHIETSIHPVSKQYTITKTIYKFIYSFLGGNLGVAIFLSMVNISTIVFTKKLLDYYAKNQKPFIKWFFAIMLNFIIAIFLPFVHNYWNCGVQEATEWHNSTYICMKLLGILAIISYFKIESNYLKKIKWKDYLLFCLLLILVNAVKPNFIIAFAPAMLFFLIIDFFKNIKDKKAIRNIIMFGFAVLISLPVLLYQSSVLYENPAEDGIAFMFMTKLRKYHQYPIISLIQSAAFPLFITLTNLKTIMKNRKYSFIGIFNVIALSEYLFLTETGSRALDGNFDWGYSFALMLAFISSIGILWNLPKPKDKKDWVYRIICYILLLLHVLSGVVYFIRLLMGYTYL